jgi:hypothetical protein
VNVDFLVVGAQKSGTTTLHQILCRHPHICLPPCKETYFFVVDEHFEKGLGFYLDHFSKCDGKKVRGEVCPAYMYWDYVPERIRDLLGTQMKLIFVLRNPVERAYSHYLMNFHKRGIEKEPFARAVSLEPERICRSWNDRHLYSYMDRGFYARQISRYLEFFPRENMKFIVFEDFIRNRENILRGLLDELNCDFNLLPRNALSIKAFSTGNPRSKLLRDFIYRPKPLPQFIKDWLKHMLGDERIYTLTVKAMELNQRELATHEKTMDGGLRKHLMNVYVEDIKKLETIIRRDLSLWYENEASAINSTRPEK